MIDFAILATLISVFAPLLAAVWRFFSVVNRLEKAIDRANSDRRVMKEKVDAALRLHDHRLREMEQTLETAFDFSPRWKRGDDCTGASFLQEGACSISRNPLDGDS